jgi:hypothetical protein
VILDRFDGQGLDGMTDSTYYCGKRLYKGEEVNFQSGYVRGGRRYSREFMQKVAERVCRETHSVAVPEIHAEYGHFTSGHDLRVPYQFWDHWLQSCEGKEHLTAGDLISDKFILAHDSHEGGGEYLTRLIDKVLAATSLKPKARPVELPEYIPEEEPSHVDEVRFCPNCEKPNQFGEMCDTCRREDELAEEEAFAYSDPRNQGLSMLS